MSSTINQDSILSGKVSTKEVSLSGKVSTLETLIGPPGPKGKDGTTPHIGANGNWYIGDTDTGVSAEGRGLPAVTASDVGKFLRVSSSGSWVAETVANANGGEF